METNHAEANALDEEELKRQEVIATANKVELPLNAEEEGMDLTKMYKLDLGDHSNYKTKLCQKRWEIQRGIWVNTRVETNEDPKGGIPTIPFPTEEGENANP